MNQYDEEAASHGGSFTTNKNYHGYSMKQQTAASRFVFAATVAAVLVSSVSVYASEADDKIESSIKETYVFKTYLKDDAVKARAEDGVVTLTGTVADGFNKALAQDTAESVRGVIRVDNQLATPAEVAAEKSDNWISRKVRLALLFHRNVSVTQTGVSVKDGIVTLTGEATSQAQKDLTTAYAKDIDDVKGVNNEMTIAATPVVAAQTLGEKIDDASVNAQVKAALVSHRSTSSVRTKVETLDGVVTLTGIAKNAAEKSLVEKLASDIRGVTSVNNKMTVE